MTFRRAVLTVLPAVGAMFVLSTGTASASCHAFTVSAQPSAVTEGGKVTVIVTRDGSQADSSVRVQTVASSATGADFTQINQTVSFAGAEVSKSLTLHTTQDNVIEPNEQLKLHLSEPQGCPSNTSYHLGPDAAITIQSDDVPPTTATTAPTTTSSSTTSSTSSTTSSTTSTTAPSTSSSSPPKDPEDVAEDSEQAAATGEGLRDEGGGSWLLPIALGGVAVVAFAGALVARHHVVGAEDLDDVDYDPDEGG